MSSGSDGRQEARPGGAGTAPGATPGDTDDLLRLAYQEIKAIARRERRRLSGGETLVTTALAHEAYLRLSSTGRFQSRGHLLATAAVAMRRILVDRVRTQLAAKRGGGVAASGLDELRDFAVEDETTVLGVSDALERLTLLNPRLTQVVECRFFAGFSELETAEALGTSVRTVQRDWAVARAWLKKELGR